MLEQKQTVKGAEPPGVQIGRRHNEQTAQVKPHKDTEDIDVYEIFLTTLSVTALKPLGGAMAQWRKRAGEHPRVDARDARGTNR